MDDDEKMKVVFAPGCFDSFDGTQEELDKFLEEITKMMESGEFLLNAKRLTDDEIDDLPDEIKQSLFGSDPDQPRRLN